MARISGKPKLPPYPRSVPEICAEELQFRSDDTMSQSTTNESLGLGTGFEQRINEDADAYAQRRATKKRRIEANAEAYLRGQSLYIMSAQLKGPFDDMWKNPWARRNSQSTVHTKENLARDVISASVAEMQSQKRKSMEGTMLVHATGRGKKTRKDAGPGKKAKKRVKRLESPVTNSAMAGNDGQGKGKVKEWLRTNDAFVNNRDKPLHQSSPTPVRRNRTNVQVPRSFEDSSSENGCHNALTAYERIQQLSRTITKVVEMPHPTPECIQSRQQEDKDEQTNSSRVEFASMNVIHVSPLAANTSGAHFMGKPRMISNDTTKVNAAPTRLGLSSHGEVNTDYPSRDRSDSVEDRNRVEATKTVDGFGIVHPEMSPLLGQSNDISISRALAEAIDHDEYKDGMKGDYHLEASVNQPATGDGFYDPPIMASGSIIAAPLGAASDSNNAELPSAQNPLYPQPSLSSVNLGVQLTEPEISLPPTQTIPQLFRSGVNSSRSAPAHDPLVKVDDVRHQAGGTVPHTKSQADKKRKRTSFANDMQNPRTLQHSLKRMAKVGKRVGILPQFEVSKGDMDGESPYNDENSSSYHVTHDITSTDNSVRKLSKGILKSTNPTNSQSSYKTTRGMNSSSQQDGQGNKLLDEIHHSVVGEEDFDLEGAISDLGSFLGSWDAEKEASGIMR